ncbi:unnamed protein product [Chironomus riparius]|uniref:Uncharacterized protein n=1 Tax=Chironomus riparius TaxID=315576 RepID=A0A9N9S044_9DIPT|nr:unnamed protein product [Chironomus riparius]
MRNKLNCQWECGSASCLCRGDLRI